MLSETQVRLVRTGCKLYSVVEPLFVPGNLTWAICAYDDKKRRILLLNNLSTGQKDLAVEVIDKARKDAEN